MTERSWQNENGSITSGGSAFSKGIVFTVTMFLMIPGIVYGVVIGRYKNDKDLWADISQGFAEMGNYVFMCFFISIFTNFFSVSKLGTVLAIRGAELLSNVGFTGIPLLIGLILLSCIVICSWICICKVGDLSSCICTNDDVNGL